MFSLITTLISLKSEPETTASAIISFLKEQFSRHAIPDVLVSDNGPQYDKREFTEFSKEWEFKHVTSSPHHKKANGKAESAVKVAKTIFKKALKDNKDPWLALLDQHNTPTPEVNSSPVQRLMSRRTRTLLPTATSLLYPKVVEGVQDKLTQKRQKSKGDHDLRTKVLPELQVGQEVRVAGQRTKTWEPGLRRNRVFLRPKLDNASLEAEREMTDQHTPAEGRESQAVAPEEAHQSKRPDQVSTGGAGRNANVDGTTPDMVTVRTSSGRVVKPPERLNL